MTDSTSGLAPARRSSRLGPLLAIGAGILGIALVSYAFPAGIRAALDGNGTGSGYYIVLFILGGLLSVATTIGSLVGLFRAGQRLLWGIALLLGLAPIVGTIVVLIVTQLSLAGPVR